MAPGNRAMQMIADAWDEDRLSYALERGTEPIQAIEETIGLAGAQARLERAKHLHSYHRSRCLSALSEHEARLALEKELAEAPQTVMVGGSYREAPTLVVIPKGPPPSALARLGAWLKSRW